jgi:hypothetical protein
VTASGYCLCAGEIPGRFHPACRSSSGRPRSYLANTIPGVSAWNSGDNRHILTFVVFKIVAMLRVPLCLIISVFALFGAVPGVCEALREKPATNMRDVEAHFRGCLQPFHEANGSRIVVYFAVKSDGQIFGPPRAVWFGSNINEGDRERILSDFLRAFRSCMPLQLSTTMSEGIPGKIYFLQFKGAPAGSEVIVRPYTSIYWW